MSKAHSALETVVQNTLETGAKGLPAAGGNWAHDSPHDPNLVGLHLHLDKPPILAVLLDSAMQEMPISAEAPKQALRRSLIRRLLKNVEANVLSCML